MKKVTEIRLAAPSKGSPVQIMECGGLFLGDGDVMLVLSSIAKRMETQYRGHLVLGEEREVEKLRHGHYEKVGGSEDKAAPVKKATTKKAASTQEPAEEGQLSDRSMGDTDGSPKRKKKKKTKASS